MNKDMKSRKDGRIDITVRNQERDDRKFYGFTKTLCRETKERDIGVGLILNI